MKSWNEIRKAATAFSKRWKDACDEKRQAQSFLMEVKHRIIVIVALIFVAAYWSVRLQNDAPRSEELQRVTSK